MGSRRSGGGRDTAKDIILGTNPSGLGPRAPREGVASPNRRQPSPNRQPSRVGGSRSPRRSNDGDRSPGRSGRRPRDDNRPVTYDPNAKSGSGGGGYGGINSAGGGFGPRSPRRSDPAPYRAVAPVQPIINATPPRDQSLYSEVAKLQAQLQAYQRSQQDLIASEAAARRRLEDQIRSNQDQVGRLGSEVRTHGQATGTGVKSQDVDDIKRRFAGLEATVLRMQQDIVHLKAMVDRHSSDLMTLNGEVKTRPNPDQKGNNTQILDGRLRDLHGQLMATRQTLDSEIGERRKADQSANEAIQRLQAMLADQDGRKNQILHELARKGDMDNAKLSEEARRLNEKIEYITNEVTRNMQDQNNQMRGEFDGKYQSLEKALRGEMSVRQEHEQKIRALLDERWRSYAQEIDDLKNLVDSDRGKNKEKFQKINEALAVLERHLEHGNKKIDRVVEAEIKSRKLHEKGLLQKLGDVEDRLSTYLNGMNKAMDDTKRGRREVHIPSVDFDGIRRDMEAIAADKNKLSMEGLLKLEEKMGRIENGLNRDSKELQSRMGAMMADGGGQNQKEKEPEKPKKETKDGDTQTHPEPQVIIKLDSDTMARLRQQLRRLDEMQEDIEKSHDKLKEKVERQIPEDLDELAQKLENSRRQLHERVDREENERYLAVRELQEEIARLKKGGVPAVPAAYAGAAPAATDERLVREVEDQKIAIKKLAESITTVKNVLDRKLEEERKARERAMGALK